MRELNFALEKAGYKPTFQYGAIFVSFPTVSICIGKDPDKEGLLMVNIQEDFDYGPKHTSLEDQTESDVMALCASHAAAAPTESPAAA